MVSDYTLRHGQQSSEFALEQRRLQAKNYMASTLPAYIMVKSGTPTEIRPPTLDHENLKSLRFKSVFGSIHHRCISRKRLE